MSLKNNEITDINALSYQTGFLYNVYLSGNKLEDISALEGLKLGNVDLRHNYLDISEGSETMEKIKKLPASYIPQETK